MLARTNENGSFLLGDDYNIWESGDDLMALKARPKLDFLSNIFIDGDMQDMFLTFWMTVKSQFKVNPYTPHPYSYKAQQNDHQY
jgi:hypothetical protein